MTSGPRIRPTRRPRVAGRAGNVRIRRPRSHDPDITAVGVAESIPGPGDGGPAGTAGAGTEDGSDTTNRRSDRRGLSHDRAVLLPAAVLALLLSASVYFGVAIHQLRSTPAMANTALVDVGTTAEVAGQLTEALETVYSYDFARLDENERAAREVITPAFATEFGELFGQVRALAPQQQAVVTATVVQAGVQSIDGDRTVLVAFMDQRATRAAAGRQEQQIAAAGRVTVTGERVGGRWRIAHVSAK